MYRLKCSFSSERRLNLDHFRPSSWSLLLSPLVEKKKKKKGKRRGSFVFILVFSSVCIPCIFFIFIFPCFYGCFDIFPFATTEHVILHDSAPFFFFFFSLFTSLNVAFHYHYHHYYYHHYYHHYYYFFFHFFHFFAF